MLITFQIQPWQWCQQCQRLSSHPSLEERQQTPDMIRLMSPIMINNYDQNNDYDQQVIMIIPHWKKDDKHIISNN